MNIARINMNIAHINMIICSYIPHSESPNDESQELGRRGFADILFNSVVAHIRDFFLDWFARIRKGSSVISFIPAQEAFILMVIYLYATGIEISAVSLNLY